MAETTVTKPIFLVGSGRSGSTLLHRVMVYHPNVAFLTRPLLRWPGKAGRHRFCLGLLDLPGARRWAGRMSPFEGWPFWNRLMAGFSQPYRDLTARDVTERIRRRFRQTVPELITRRRPRLWEKLTGWTRVGFLKEVFPDARIVHLIRDPRATASSLIHVDFWRGWHGPERWRWGPLSDEQQRVWQMHGKSFVVLALIQWHKIIEAFRQSVAELTPCMQEHVMTVRYADFCRDPQETLNRILDFCDLPCAEALDRALELRKPVPDEGRWRKDLTFAQQTELESAVDELAVRSFCDTMNREPLS